MSPGHSNAVVSLKFSADGLRLASASADKTAKIWDPFSGRCLVTLEGHTKVATFSGADCGVWSECPLMIGLWGRTGMPGQHQQPLYHWGAAERTHAPHVEVPGTAVLN